ncbi:MAG: hypothetical protein K1X78_07440 [Verrucomicrobiaceae bacterium]|nr:hypothetical protein [Verrucomicrobiaceae bacterium]
MKTIHAFPIVIVLLASFCHAQLRGAVEGGGRGPFAVSAPATTFTDTFTTGDGTGVANGNLHGNQVEVGTAVWQAEAAYFYSATNRAENDSTRLPLTSVDSRIAYLNTPLAAGEAITVEADVSPPFGNAAANVWTAIGVANNPAALSGSGFFNAGVGQVWILLAKDGSWNAFANATAIALGSGAAGTAPGFVVGMNHLKLQYDAATNKASAWINGTQVLTDVSLGAFTPVITATGFQTFRKEQAAVDNFSVTFGQNSQPTPVQTTFGDVVSGAGAPNAAGADSGADFDLLKRGGFLAENGNLIFPGQLLIGTGGVTLSPNNYMGLWKHDGVSLKLLARSGNDAPETGGTAAKWDVLPTVPAINDSGEVTFLASLVVSGASTPPTTVDNDTGLWSELGSTGLGILMREGDTIPNLSPLQVGGFASGCFATAHTSASTGEAAFAVTMKNGSADTAILRASITSPAVTAVGVVVRENTAMPGVAGEQFANLASTYSDALRMDSAGNLCFVALSKTGRESIWYQPASPAGSTAVKAFIAGTAATGDTAPGTGATFKNIKSPSMGSAGTICFRGFLNANGDNTSGKKGDGIWRGSVAGGFQCILRAGDDNTNRPGLGLPAGAKVGNLWHSWLTNANHGAWKGWLDVNGNGTSSTTDGDVNAIYTDLSGTMTLALKVGDAAPGIGGATFSGFDLPVVGGTEQMAFLGTVTGGGTTSANNKGVWRSAANGGALSLVLRAGDTMTTTQGVKTISNVDFPGSNTTDRRWEQPVMDSTGRLLVYVTFVGGATTQVLVP